MAIHAIQNTQMLDLIESVYEAAIDEKCWHALAPRIATVFNSVGANLMVREAGAPRILTITDNISSTMEAYRHHFWDRDVWIQGAQGFGISQVAASQDFITDAEFQETEFYREWARHLDLFYVVGSVFRSGPNELGVLGVFRPRGAGMYQETDKLLAARLLTHLKRALQIRNRLAGAAFLRRISLEALNRTDTAALVVAADGRIIYANPPAELLLSSRGALCVQKGQLAARLQSDSARLLSLIRSASNMGEASNSPGGVMAIRQAKELPLTMLVAPFRLAPAGLPTPSAIVFIRDPSRSITATSALQSLFQLTPAEARIAQELANGKSLAEIAGLHRASQQTVRKQLKAIFAKTGTNRQAQCVAAILRSVAAIARD
jgi:DNA-binding CsgD family transcriptional regulator